MQLLRLQHLNPSPILLPLTYKHPLLPPCLTSLPSLLLPNGSCGLRTDESAVKGCDNKPCLTKALFSCIAKLSHGLYFVSKGGMCTVLQSQWFTKGLTTFPGKTKPLVQIVAHLLTIRPFQHNMIDFIKLSPNEKNQYCFTVVNMFSKWVDVFLAKQHIAFSSS